FEALKTARSWASAAAIPGVAALFGSGLSWWVVLLVIAGAVALISVSAVFGFLSWRATTYRVSGGAFRLRSGVFQKNERTIPLEHVQSVDTVQGFIQRILNSTGVLNVVEVRIETAGGGASETDALLSALTREDADYLRGEVEGARRDAVEEEPGPTVIRRLTARELLIAGATSGQIGAAAALIGVGSQFFDDFVDGFLSENFVEGIVETVAPYAFLAVTFLVITVGLVAWLLAIAGTVISYSGFTISRSADGKYLNIKRGFIRRTEATIPISRIQAVRIVEGLLRQPFGLATLRVESAGYGAGTEDVGVSTTLFPLLPRSRARDFLSQTAPEFAVDAKLNPLPKRAARRYVFRSTAPWLVPISAVGIVLFTSGISLSLGPASIGIPGAALPLETYFAIPATLILLLAALYGWAAYRAAGWAMEDDCFISRSRTLARTTAIAPRKRLQSRSLVRSPFQRRARLATLQTRVASGSGGTTFEVVDLESSSAGELIERLDPKKQGVGSRE
ncbi:MAG: PH domain-containing protein, partial [Rubrobacteraceae bacterium]